MDHPLAQRLQATVKHKEIRPKKNQEKTRPDEKPRREGEVEKSKKERKQEQDPKNKGKNRTKQDSKGQDVTRKGQVKEEKTRPDATK